jgi:transposase
MRRKQRVASFCLQAACDRFSHPRQVMAYLGLIPSENTSSDKRRQGAITKCGNAHARWWLVECAQHYVAPPKVSKELSRRQQGQPPEVRALSWRAQNRLHARFARLSARPRKNKVYSVISIETKRAGGRPPVRSITWPAAS